MAARTTLAEADQAIAAISDRLDVMVTEIRAAESAGVDRSDAASLMTIGLLDVIQTGGAANVAAMLAVAISRLADMPDVDPLAGIGGVS